MNKLSGTVILIAAVLVLAACSGIAAIYEDETKILDDSDTYNLVSVKQTITDQQLSFTADKIEGTETIWTYDAEEATELDMAGLITVTSGKAKLVFLSPDDNLTSLIEITEPNGEGEEFRSTLPVKEGRNRIKIVAGEDTKLDLELTIPEGEFHSLGFE